MVDQAPASVAQPTLAGERRDLAGFATARTLMPMPTVLPRPPRWRRVETAAGCQIIIPARRHWPALASLTVWVVAWASGEGFALLLLLQSGAPPTSLALPILPWLAVWTVVGLASLHAWLWLVAGREVVTVDTAALAIRREVLGVGRTRDYAFAHISNFQAVPWTEPPSTWASRGGSVLFGYGSDTVRFGIGLSGLEAKQLVRAVREAGPHGVAG